MAPPRSLVAIVIVCAACTSAGGPDKPSGSTTSTEGTSTTTTLPDGPPGLDLDMYRNGLIDAEQGAVNDLIDEAPFYDLDLALSDDLSLITGTEQVRFTNLEDVPLDEVVFRLFPNLADGMSVVSDLTVDGNEAMPVFELQQSVMRIRLEEPLAPGDRLDLSMTIEVKVPTEEGGNYGTFLLRDGILAAAHFYPLLAVFDDEGWNAEIPAPSGDVVYSDVGFYRVSVEAPDDLPIVTSGQITAKEAPGADGRGRRTFVAGPVRDFYLAASRRFSLVQGRIGQTIVNSYAPPEFVTQNKEVLRLAVSSLGVYNELYGAYPYSELDIVSTGTLALGVEYPGVIAMNLGHYDPEAEYDPATVASTIVHEVAHQWFYGTVGNDQLDEPWLDESLAQYATWAFWRLTQGPEADEGFRQHLVSRWERVESADIPIGLPVASYEGPQYSAIVYGRGPLFLQDLAEIMGTEVFDAFVADYARTYRYRIASTEDFQELAQTHCGCDLTAEFDAAVYPR